MNCFRTTVCRVEAGGRAGETGADDTKADGLTPSWLDLFHPSKGPESGRGRGRLTSDECQAASSLRRLTGEITI